MGALKGTRGSGKGFVMFEYVVLNCISPVILIHVEFVFGGRPEKLGGGLRFRMAQY